MPKVHYNDKLINNLRVYSKAVDPKDKFSIYYIGTKQRRDDIHCNYETYNPQSNSDKCEYIDTGGGTIDDIDLVTGCKKVIIRPYTSYSSKTDASSYKTSDTRYFNIKTDGYESDKNSFANISLSSTDRAHITFSNISVLLDTKEVVYISQNQTLVMKFLLSEGGVFTLYLEPYTIKDQFPNFTVLDKYGYTTPMFDSSSSNITYIEKFVRYIKMGNYTDIDQLKAKHQSVLREDRVYKVFSTIETSNGMYMIGSTGNDVLYIDQNTHYVCGGEEMDVYSTSDQWPMDGVIDNRSEDKMLDFLSITFDISNITLYREKNIRAGKSYIDLGLLNYAGQNLLVANYFRGNEYKHLIVIDRNNESYIPSHTGSGYIFIPFYYIIQGSKNYFVMPSNFQEFAVAAQKENIESRTEHFSLIVEVHDGKEGPIELTITIDDFYSSNRNVKMFLYDDGGFYSHNYIIFDHLKFDYDNPTNFDALINTLQTTRDNLNSSKTYDDSTNNLDNIDSNSILDVRHMHFIKDTIIMFNHKIENNVLTSVPDTEQKLGVLVIHDVPPSDITVIPKYNDLILSASNQRRLSESDEEDKSVTIRNYFVNAEYSIYILQFDFTDDDPIQIYTYNNSQFEIEIKLSRAHNIYLNNKYFSLIKVNDLRCAYSLYNMKLQVNGIHKMLGFESLVDMLIFTSECTFNNSLLSKLKKNLDAFKYYNEMLLDNIFLQNYNTTYAADLSRVLTDYFLPINITNFMEIVIKAQDGRISRTDSDSDTKVRHERSVHFNDGDISEYNMQSNINSAMLDSSTRISSSASKSGSWFSGVSKKISNFVKSITKVGQQFWDSSIERLDLDAIINTKSIDPVLLNDYGLIADGNISNNAKAVLTLGHFDINNILYLGIVFCTKNRSLKNSYISPQKLLDIQREIVFQEILQNLEHGMNRWNNNTYEEDCGI